MKSFYPCKAGRQVLFFTIVVMFIGARAPGAGFVARNVGTVFMIGMENHNFTQPNPFGSSPEQISNNPACPFLNGLITPGNANAAQVSFCTKYYNTGTGCHPSEPNYIWEEAGSNLGILADSDPSSGAGNIFSVMHFTKQLDAAGITWKNYEEDVEYTTPTVSKSGTRPSGTNFYNGSTQYYYGAKHNPMCFFTDSQTKNVFSLTNFLPDLTNNNLGKYNWIMPDMYNCMHSGTTASFTYHGTVYTGGSDQCAVAEGDNFLSIIIPKIMAAPAFTNNGIIIIRFDETEGGDTTSYTVPEIIISPLAKGNAYASSVVMSHSSDVKTLEEIYGLNFTNSAGANYLSNAIPSGETAATPASTYNNIGGATVNDLSDLFQGFSSINVLQSGTVLTNGGSAPTFGTVNVGTAVTNIFSVTNSGTATLILSNIVVSGTNAGDFTVSGITLPASVAMGGTITLNVVFAPGGGGTRSANLQITNNDALHNPFILGLAGIGIVPPPVILAGQTQLSAGGFQMTFSGSSNQAYRVWASGDLTVPLTNWIVLGSGLFGSTNGIFTDTNTGSQPARFYRISTP
jgi:hypothetical protein